ncbi:putative leucine-rich repeat receptor-like protein kinase At2g19210 [Pistacia vera]|uniref:putative leucine-rich repeat receptor-like protein kinase At2g19210 n=1 Tax=Pistacia vera TaxID=55513 RepID=UPI001263E662|nr:putative leucine-rich repeat receptor-like protein kinase At2g19210 [Pistacia vera]
MGFFSLDCGTSSDSNYTDKITGIDYMSDAYFIETGVNNKISSAYENDNLEQQFLYVRSFPEGKRNCYTLKPEGGYSKFLIRARFMHGNYDGEGSTPSFDLFLDSEVWDSVELSNPSTIVNKEIIHTPKNNYIYVCLVNTDSGTPFISALELRPLKNTTYVTQSGSLQLKGRWYAGAATNENIRYGDDVHDRIWTPWGSNSWETKSSTKSINLINSAYDLPSRIMSTAYMPASGKNYIDFVWETNETKSTYVYLYFAEVEVRQANQTREMNIYSNGRLWYGPFTLSSLYITTLESTGPILGKKIIYEIDKTENSTLPPIMNAIEIYWVKEFSQLLTNQQDVDAIMMIKRKYGVKRNWQGDPCVPKLYMWQGLDCSYTAYEPPRIISLNLSSSGLSGQIIPYIFSLTAIQSLDLSNNYLTGQVPDFLSELQYLRMLNLAGNNLKGSIPAGLKEKEKNGLLSLSVDGNSNPCPPVSCKEQKKFNIVPVVASVVSVLVVLAAILAILWIHRRRKVGKKGSLELKKRRFTYSDLVTITNNFERVLGKGGFGAVYHGYLDNTQVAVKMLSASSAQGYKEFQAEVELLLEVHHKNLTSLVEYCDEGKNIGLIYEFMANGNLEAHLSGKNENVLKWEGRLRIATEAAHGLEYLHSDCRQPTVHRDVKSTNILLNEKFQAKLSDFGLSRIFLVESGTHVSITNIAGTPGYLDPEYYISNRLTEKSDVYSFGVVLLEIITSKPVIEKSFERTHISQSVNLMLTKGDIKNIVDPRLHGDFDINSVWKAVEIAMACVSRDSTKRPTMHQVVMELNESLAIEIARAKAGSNNKSKDHNAVIE